MRRRELVGTTAAVLVLLAAFAVGLASAMRAAEEEPVATPVATAAAPRGVAGPLEPPRPPATRVPVPAPGDPAPQEPTRRPSTPELVRVPVPEEPSRAVGKPNDGRLVNGVLLPEQGPDFTTWDVLDEAFPNRDWRRVGTDRLVARVYRVAAAYRRANPGAPRMVVNDLSLPEGGPFGPEYGGLGHASHQNGLDVDISYPRKDRREIGVEKVSEVDLELAQELVDAWVATGAKLVFVGLKTPLRGPKKVVQAIPFHDDHLHVRLPPAR